MPGSGRVSGLARVRDILGPTDYQNPQERVLLDKILLDVVARKPARWQSAAVALS